MSQAGVLVIEDEGVLASNIQRYLQREGFEVRTAATGQDGLRQCEAFGPDVVLLDLGLPDMPGLDVLARIRSRDSLAKLIILTAHGSTQVAVDAMKAGAYDYLSKPVALAELKRAVEKAVGLGRLEGALSYYRGRDACGSGLAQLLGESPAILALKRSITRLLEAEARLAPGDPPPPVLIRGETGSGKELVARALHFDGTRRDGPFVEVNCAALPAHLLEGELFGHERGAFTDARERRLGLVEAAHGGTLFLDEIGDLEPALQVKLLKLIEDRTVRRLGSTRDRRVDVRFLAATHHPLERMVQEGRFRADFYYRLRVIMLEVPPLRERDGDVMRLAQHFLASLGQRYGRPGLRLAAGARALAERHPWPGNVRELRNVMEQAVLSADGDIIEIDNLAIMPPAWQPPRPAELAPGAASLSLTETERLLIAQALEQNDGNVTRAARKLGISRDTLRYRLGKQARSQE
ncbi:acetoacetate metabolism regulatory protein AtoC [Siccirubricoccus deserti]|uniref:Sigma-54-dependent Fis family transcriptional regulator n=1 Tax=Siccirubricoccus deserti TaxID=2013562 RepID=A0A9X0UBY4_9PROT|nr:sigma-54 dependent transcriptional regulator [Siccirubricoccus deserti]MBC4013841.1 sigma-54-dependent Fis family transcriptional regulator [Siccirubricoccus deserti]GGC29916.1 acetoacetate metabolism regulatory protein AtoC [Siccirubricoccus deserti]